MAPASSAKTASGSWEDPANDFLPSAGRLDYIVMPLDGRIDTSLEDSNRVGAPNSQGVSIYYDPMIAKLISHSENRTKTIAELCSQADDVKVYPLKTNASYIYRVLQLDSFISGNVSTGLLAENHSTVLTEIDNRRKDRHWQAIIELVTRRTGVHYGNNYGNKFAEKGHAYTYAWRMNLPNRFSQTYFCNGERYDVSVNQLSSGWQYMINGETVPATFDQFKSTEGLLGSSGNALTAPMPGKIIAVNAKVGEAVKAGNPLIILEAMKMEMTLEAPRDGVVAEVSAAVDALVTDGEMLLALEEIEKEK